MQKAFTLTELIIVIAIIALFAAIAIPTFRNVRNQRPYNPKSEQQILEEAAARVRPAEKPIRPVKDIRFTYESQGVSPENKPITLVTDKTTGKQYLIVGEGGVEIK